MIGLEAFVAAPRHSWYLINSKPGLICEMSSASVCILGERKIGSSCNCIVWLSEEEQVHSL